jgi:short-subunit dehydrogenase
MMARGSGHIVPIASSAGLYGVYGYSAYGASKFALVGLAECLRSELCGRGIRVSVCCPPEVDTPILAAEKDDLPPATRMLKNLAGTLNVDAAADALVKGIVKNRFMIIPGFRAKVFYWLKRLAPGPVFWGLPDAIVKKMDR